METIKQASAFFPSYTGELDEALQSTEAVVEFISDCGGPEKARAASEAFRAVGEAINGK